MLTYYTKRAFEIFREDGLKSLIDTTWNHLIKRRYKYLKRRAKIKYKYYLMRRRYDAVADPYKIVNINPNDVTKYLTRPRPSWYDGKYSMYGRVQAGDWDVEHTKPDEERPNYQYLKSHFAEGKSWEESDTIDYYWNRIQDENRNSIHGCQTREELLDYYKGIDDLYSEIKEHGYRKIPRSGFWDPRDYDVVSVHIGRGGEFIFSGSGNHRLSIAKILEIEEIPVRVLGRHEQWQELRDEIHNNGLPETREELRDHPDLQDVLN